MNSRTIFPIEFLKKTIQNKMRKSILVCLTLVLSQIISAQNDSFKLCGDQKTYPYYYPELKFKGDFFELKTQLLSNLDNDKLDDKINGIITIQFHVNCEGSSGDYRILQTDLDYNETFFDEKSMNHLLDLVKNLKGWIPAINEVGENINSHKFITFRIMAGQIIEILPK